MNAPINFTAEQREEIRAIVDDAVREALAVRDAQAVEAVAKAERDAMRRLTDVSVRRRA